MAHVWPEAPEGYYADGVSFMASKAFLTLEIDALLTDRHAALLPGRVCEAAATYS